MTHLFLAISIVSFADDTERDKAIAAIDATGATIHTYNKYSSTIRYISAIPSKNRNLTFSAREMKLLKHFPHLEELSLHWPLISADGLKQIVQLKSLKKLWLSGFSPTEETIKILNSLDQFNGKKVQRDGKITLMDVGKITITLANSSDEDLRLIGKLSKLRSLIVHDSPKVTDAGLEYLWDLQNLRSLYFINTEVTDEVLETLQQILPNLRSASTTQIKGTFVPSPTGGGFF